MNRNVLSLAGAISIFAAGQAMAAPAASGSSAPHLTAPGPVSSAPAGSNATPTAPIGGNAPAINSIMPSSGTNANSPANSLVIKPMGSSSCNVTGTLPNTGTANTAGTMAPAPTGILGSANTTTGNTLVRTNPGMQTMDSVPGLTGIAVPSAGSNPCP